MNSEIICKCACIFVGLRDIILGRKFIVFSNFSESSMNQRRVRVIQLGDPCKVASYFSKVPRFCTLLSLPCFGGSMGVCAWASVLSPEDSIQARLYSSLPSTPPGVLGHLDPSRHRHCYCSSTEMKFSWLSPAEPHPGAGAFLYILWR